jgi:DNA (cytosine-5)-methyltransferase 1
MGMRLLDLFSGAGGSAMGYYRGGIVDIVGIDIEDQPHYPFTFIRANAFEYLGNHGEEYDLIHASPPCQAYSVTRHIHSDIQYPDLIGLLRTRLQATGKPYIIENVIGAPLIEPIMLCGLMFGLRVLRHRLFEVCPRIKGLPHPGHSSKIRTKSRSQYSSFAGGATHITVAGNNFNRRDGLVAMGIDWEMSRKELAQAIPPAYTYYIGRMLLKQM